MLYMEKKSNMDVYYIFKLLLIFLWSYPVTAIKRQVCQQVGPLRCKNGGVLYIQSVYCSSYDYAMQLLQENCSGFPECRTDILRKFLQPRCCGQHAENPHIIYQCNSGTGSGEVIQETSRLDRGVSGEVVSTIPDGHSLHDEMVIVAVFTGFVFLWGVGLIFFHLRYNSNHCSWVRRGDRTYPIGQVDSPVYIPRDTEDPGQYVEIETLSNTHLYSNVIIPSAPPPMFIPHPLPG